MIIKLTFRDCAVRYDDIKDEVTSTNARGTSTGPLYQFTLAFQRAVYEAARAEQVKARGTQSRRVRRARFALVASKYCRAGYVPVYERNDAVRDMLSDLRHLCDAWGVAFGDADRVAHDRYLAERGAR